MAVIGQSTWYIDTGIPDLSIAALRRGLGMTHIDTAEMYGSGDAEELVGRAIAGRQSCKGTVRLSCSPCPVHKPRR
jgi:diketogulonate reductase-like aldo/keto reductase